VAAPTVRASGTALFGTASTLTPVIPTHVTDDILLFWAASSANASVTPTHSTPTGFTLLASAVITTGVTRSRISCYWKRATSGSETNQAITFTPTGSTACHHMAVVQSVQGCVTAGNPYENAQTNQAAGASSIGVTRTVSGANRLSFFGAHHADNVASAATEDRTEAYTQHYGTANATGIDGFSAIWSFGPIGSTGDTATLAFTGGGTGVGIAGLAYALVGAASTFNDSVTETSSGTDGFATAATFPNDLAESGTGTDALIGGLVFTDARTESASAGDSLAPAWTANESRTEAANGTDALSTVGVFGAAQSEAATASDSLSCSAIWPNLFGATSAAADALTQSAVYSSSCGETSSAIDGLADEYIGQQGQIFNDSVGESSSALDVVNGAAVFPSGVSASVTAADALWDEWFGLGVYNETITEAADAESHHDWYLIPFATSGRHSQREFRARSRDSARPSRGYPPSRRRGS
jgi:hypothetical protein